VSFISLLFVMLYMLMGSCLFYWLESGDEIVRATRRLVYVEKSLE